jgi:hypothetical protein
MSCVHFAKCSRIFFLLETTNHLKDCNSICLNLKESAENSYKRLPCSLHRGGNNSSVKGDVAVKTRAAHEAGLFMRGLRHKTEVAWKGDSGFSARYAVSYILQGRERESVGRRHRFVELGGRQKRLGARTASQATTHCRLLADFVKILIL